MSNKNQTIANLSLNGNYAETVLSYYLWGEPKQPEPFHLADGRYADRPENIIVSYRDTKNNTAKLAHYSVQLQIDAKEYMNKIGNNLPMQRQGIFQKFFDNVKDGTINDKNIQGFQTFTLTDIQNHGGKLIHGGKEIELNHQQFIDLVYGVKSVGVNNFNNSHFNIAKSAHLLSTQYYIDTKSPDYWQRSFVFGSTALKLNTDKIKYIFDAQTGKSLRIENIYVKPVDDNFDFLSDDGTAKIVNPLLRQIMDPSATGKPVHLKYINNDEYFILPFGTIFTRENYNQYEYGFDNYKITDQETNKTHTIHIAKSDSANYPAFFDGLQKLHKTSIYNFRDDHERVVIFGTDNGDNLNSFTTLQQYLPNKYMRLDQEIDVSSINSIPKKWWAEFYYDIDNMNKFMPYLKNGLVYIGGKGGDTITGSEYDDILIAGNTKDDQTDEATNTLTGGLGEDKLYGSGGDDILIAGLSEMIKLIYQKIS